MYYLHILVVLFIQTIATQEVQTDEGNYNANQLQLSGSKEYNLTILLNNSYQQNVTLQANQSITYIVQTTGKLFHEAYTLNIFPHLGVAQMFVNCMHGDQQSSEYLISEYQIRNSTYKLNKNQLKEKCEAKASCQLLIKFVAGNEFVQLVMTLSQVGEPILLDEFQVWPDILNELQRMEYIIFTKKSFTVDIDLYEGELQMFVRQNDSDTKLMTSISYEQEFKESGSASINGPGTYDEIPYYIVILGRLVQNQYSINFSIDGGREGGKFYDSMYFWMILLLILIIIPTICRALYQYQKHKKREAMQSIELIKYNDVQ